jgi:hypothetical protein
MGAPQIDQFAFHPQSARFGLVAEVLTDLKIAQSVLPKSYRPFWPSRLDRRHGAARTPRAHSVQHVHLQSAPVSAALTTAAVDTHLIPNAAAHLIRHQAPAATIVEIDAPHFLLQSRPSDAADAIRMFLQQFDPGRGDYTVDRDFSSFLQHRSNDIPS